MRWQVTARPFLRVLFQYELCLNPDMHETWNELLTQVLRCEEIHFQIVFSEEDRELS